MHMTTTQTICDLESSEVTDSVVKAMQQAAAALAEEYPADLSRPDLEEHIKDLVYRFRNRALGDTVYRVGRDLYRKLAKDDRLVGAMLLCRKHRLPCDCIADAVAAGTVFRAKDEHGKLFKTDEVFVEKEFSSGFNAVLASVCKLDPASPLEQEVIEELKKAHERQNQSASGLNK